MYSLNEPNRVGIFPGYVTVAWSVCKTKQTRAATVGRKGRKRWGRRKRTERKEEREMGEERGQEARGASLSTEIERFSILCTFL